VSEFLLDYGLILLFGIIAAQAMGVPGPPGKTALVAAALLAADGRFNLWSVLAVAAVACALGGYAGYFVGRKGGLAVLEAPFFADRLRGSRALMERLFERHGGKAVFVARFFPGAKVVAAPAAGVAQMPWRKFAAWHTLAAVGFAVLFGLMGFYLGRGAIELAERVGVYVAAGIVAVAALAWLVLAAVRRRTRSPRRVGELEGSQGAS
jgi:membrane protein DedA with SNARE-associated domain